MWRGVRLVLAVVGLVGCGLGMEDGSTPSPQVAPGTQEQAHRVRTPPETRWAQPVRGVDDDRAVAVAHDSEGNVLVLGNYFSPIEIGGDGTMGPAERSLITALLKYRPDGSLMWSRLFVPERLSSEAPGVSIGTALAVDRDGNIYVAGETLGELFLEEGEEVPTGPFLARFAPGGRLLRARSLPIRAGALVAERHGTVVLGATLDGTVDFGRGPVTGASQPVIARYDAEGRLRWFFLDPERGALRDLARDDSGNFFYCGNRLHPTDSSFPIPFVAKATARGTRSWSRSLEGARGLALSIAVHDNDVVASGDFTGAFTFADRTVTATRLQNFVVSFSRGGGERWAVALGDQEAFVALDARGGVFVTGRYDSNEDFGLGLGRLPGTTLGIGNVYVARLHRNNGRLDWIRTFPGGAAPADLSVTKHGAAAVIGVFGGAVDFGTTTLDTVGKGDDVFVVQLERPEGS